MKLTIYTLALVAMVGLSACSKSDGGGGGGGSGNPATQPPQNIPQVNTNPYDNGGQPDLSKDHVAIMNRHYIIFNTDGMFSTDCNGPSAPPEPFMCTTVNNAQNQPQKIRESIHNFTVVSSTSYLYCLNQGFGDNKAKPQNCAAATRESDKVKTEFIFDQNGFLRFSANINNYSYTAINIPYRFNPAKGLIQIREFTANGTNPNQRFLHISSVPQRSKDKKSVSSDLILKAFDVTNMSESDVDPEMGAFRASDALILKLANFDDRYNTMPTQYNGQPQMQGSYPNQPNQQYANQPYGPQQPYQQQPQGPNSTKILVVGGQVALFPQNLVPMVDNLQNSRMATGGGLGQTRGWDIP